MATSDNSSKLIKLNQLTTDKFFRAEVSKPKHNSELTLLTQHYKCVTPPTSTIVVNVKDLGAKGNGIANDTVAIQSAIDQVTGTGGIVHIPNGIYMIDAVVHLLLKSNMTISMDENTVLKAIPNNQKNYGIIRIEHAENANIVGGTVEGERNQHEGSGGEWGMGIEIYDSKNVVIEQLVSKDNWGDGFYVGNNSVHSLFCSVTADNNRRQGMSITSADSVRIMDSIFKNTHGTAPMDGLDLEPNEGETINNVQILNSHFLNNQGCGIELSVPDNIAKTGAIISSVTIDSNHIINNGEVGAYSAGIKVSRASMLKVTNNIVNDNLQDGIIIVNESSNNLISGNQVTKNGNPTDTKNGYGILLYQANQNTVANNFVNANRKKNIFDSDSKGSLIENNTP